MPEVEHLRAQASAHQAVLAEKLSLQRELNAVQVELQTERRAAQRVAIKGNGKETREEKLAADLGRVQSELAAAKREKQTADQELQKKTTEFETKKVLFESRIETVREKLRATKEELKVTQADLHASRSGSAGDGRKGLETSRNPRKRSAAPFEQDVTLGTPGQLPAAKKAKRVSTIPGDKSTFSITPFLNRTISVAPESPPKDVEPETGEEEAENVQGAPKQPTLGHNTEKKSVTKQGGQKVPRARVQSGKSGASTLTKSGPTNAKRSNRENKLELALDQVREEEDTPVAEARKGAAGHDASLVVKSANGSLGNDSNTTNLTMVKRKRKILGSNTGKTLFDEDEGEPKNSESRGLFGAGLRGRGKPVLGFGTGRLGNAAGSGATSTFAFSPLKRDRR